MAKGTSSELSEQTKRKLEEAKSSYLAIMEEIAPFVRAKRRRRYSTAGEWRVLRYKGTAPPAPPPKGILSGGEPVDAHRQMTSAPKRLHCNDSFAPTEP